MRFPKAELDLDKYRQIIGNLLADEDCHLFIDTNIISQLYKLNDKAREDFFNWVSSVSSRFHIPSWVVHEYQKRYVSQKTKEYLTELENGDVVKRLKNLSVFAKGYVSDSLLDGSVYQGKKDELFKDLDEVSRKFEIINYAITKKSSEHQLKVHADILSKLGEYSLSTDIYSILKDVAIDGEMRYKHLVPPGFEDGGKVSNCFGDLIIWREILDYCELFKVSKAIWITKDEKPDMVYTPQRQLAGGFPCQQKKDVANESLVFEFYKKTNSDDFYIINFLTLAECLATRYQSLATSFQIVTTHEQNEDKGENDSTECTEELLSSNVAEAVTASSRQQIEQGKTQLGNPYSQRALADKDCEEWCEDSHMCNIIRGLKSHNWYVQNDAVNYLECHYPEISADLDAFFVLGRNIYQSAVGSAFNAINFIENLTSRLKEWEEKNQRAVIDGMLYEVFFDSEGMIRSKGFKAYFFEPLLDEIDQLQIEKPYAFINSCLKKQANVRFVPEVHTGKDYKFSFEFEKIEANGDAYVKRLCIDQEDVSVTFTKESYYAEFAEKGELKSRLSCYYAIPEEQIMLDKIDGKVNKVFFIGAFD